MRVFRVHADHSFEQSAHSWLDLIETQATAGLVHFLNQGGPAASRARIAALFAACGAAAPCAAELENAFAIAEQRLPDAGRLDIVAYARGLDGRDRLLIIEAKFGHALKRRQLARYEDGLASVIEEYDLDVAPDDVTLLVVGIASTPGRERELRRRPAWRFLAWRELLLALDRHLLGEDDIEFRRFRRTLWERG